MNTQPTGAADQQPTASRSVLEAKVGSAVWRVIDFLKGVPTSHKLTATFVDDLAFSSMTVVTMYAICEELFEVELFDSEQVADQKVVGELVAHLSGLLDSGTGQLPDDAAIEKLLAQYG